MYQFPDVQLRLCKFCFIQLGCGCDVIKRLEMLCNRSVLSLETCNYVGNDIELFLIHFLGERLTCNQEVGDGVSNLLCIVVCFNSHDID